MAKYLVIKPFRVGDGFMNNKDGKSVPMQSLVPQPSQIVQGRIETRTIGGQRISGVPFNILTKIKGNLENAVIMIPEENLELIEEEKVAKDPQPIVVQTMNEPHVDIVVPSKNTETTNEVEVEESPVFDLLGFIFE